MKKSYSCKLSFGYPGPKEDRRLLYASSAELVGDDIVIHLSRSKTFVSKPLAQAAVMAFMQCTNVTGDRHTIVELDINRGESFVPDIDDPVFANRLRAYMDAYGCSCLDNLLNGYLIPDLPAQEEKYE